MLDTPVIAPPVISPNKMQRNSKDLTVLTERHRLFKEAALDAKREGNVNVALVYLKHAKGFEQMIKAAEHGLPLDMTNLPVPPQLAASQHRATAAVNKTPPKSASSAVPASSINTFEIVQLKEDDLLSNDRDFVYKRLIKDMAEQIKVVATNAKHFQNMGDIHNAKKLFTAVRLFTSTVENALFLF